MWIVVKTITKMITNRYSFYSALWQASWTPVSLLHKNSSHKQSPVFLWSGTVLTVVCVTKIEISLDQNGWSSGLFPREKEPKAFNQPPASEWNTEIMTQGRSKPLNVAVNSASRPCVVCVQQAFPSIAPDMMVWFPNLGLGHLGGIGSRWQSGIAVYMPDPILD